MGFSNERKLRPMNNGGDIFQKVPFRMTFNEVKDRKKGGARSAPPFFPSNFPQIVILKGTFWNLQDIKLLVATCVNYQNNLLILPNKTLHKIFRKQLLLQTINTQMKKSLLIATFFLFSGSLLAQKIKVSETNESIGGGNHNALSVTIYQAAPEEIEKEVKSLMKHYDAKVAPQNGGLFGDNAMIKKISNNTVDLYAKVEKIKEGETRLVMAFDLGGAYLSSSNSKQYEAAKEILMNLATKTTTDAMAELVKTEQKSFDKMSGEQKKLEKENQNLNDDVKSNKDKIEDCNRRIKQAENDIEANRKNQEKKKADIAVQQKVLADAKQKQQAHQ
jgi:hypothetical protein